MSIILIDILDKVTGPTLLQHPILQESSRIMGERRIYGLIILEEECKLGAKLFFAS